MPTSWAGACSTPARSLGATSRRSTPRCSSSPTGPGRCSNAQGGTSFTFVTEGLERAIELARDAAGRKDVAVAGGGELVRQVLAAGLTRPA